MGMMYAERAASRQITGATAVIGVHAALIFAIVTGLAERPPIIPKGPPIQAYPVADAPPDDPKPIERPDVDDVSRDKITIPVPQVPPVDDSADDVIRAEPTINEQRPPITTAAISRPLPLRSDPRHPLAPPVYPPGAIRDNQQGVVQLLIYVLPNGRVGDVKVGRSSGFPLLDDAALRKAKAAWRFLPATSGSGQAIAAWGTYDVRFELKLN